MSVERPDRFWAKTLELLDIEWFEPYRQFVDLSRGPEWPEWFVGGRLNLAHNGVTRHAQGPRSARAKAAAERPALIWECENGKIVQYNFRELELAVAQASNAFAALGVRRGDRVGLFLPMLPETAIAALAVARLGAIFIPLFSGFGAQAVGSRLADAEAKLRISAAGCFRCVARA